MVDYRVSLIFPLIVVSLLLTSCVTVYNPVTAREEPTLIGESREIQIGREAAESLEKKQGLVNSPEMNRRIKRIGEEIARVCGRSHLPYSFKILKSKDVNALALPGGFIYVTKGLMKVVETDSQLASILGHEVGHVCARHAIKKLEAQIGYSLLYTLIFRGEKEDIQKLANMTFNLVTLGYSRQDEFQADELGIKYAYKAGYNPHGMAEFLKVLKKNYKRTPSQIEVFFSTHPHIDDRIERAEELADEMLSKRSIFSPPLLFAEEVTNLIPNGDFEEGDSMPYHWGTKVKKKKGIKVLPSDPRYGGKIKEGINLLWVVREDGSRCIKFFLNEEAPRYASVCETSGMSYDSELVRIEPLMSHTIEVEVKSTGPEAIIFTKGYKTHSERGFIEAYRAPLFCHFTERKNWNTWERFSRTFKIPFPDVTWIKVSLYGYGAKKGELYFDKVRVAPSDGNH